MAPLESSNSGLSSSKPRSAFAATVPGVGYEQTLAPEHASRFVFEAPVGAILTLSGIDSASLRELVDGSAHGPDDRRALFLSVQSAPSVEAYVEAMISRMAEAALRLWPMWYTDVSFASCNNDTLGRQAAGVIARETAAIVSGTSAVWAEAATRCALAGRPPRIDGMLAAIEIAQLSLAICRAGLVLVADANAAAARPNADALVHALEWIAQNARAAVIVLLSELPPHISPFDRILYGARSVSASICRDICTPENDEAQGPADLWLAPWRGSPHPMSEIEQRLAAMVRADDELASLFRFNWSVHTERGSCFRGDLVWTEGRLVVELDGYPDHSTRRAFRCDRHRDYELTLSGYTVLRLANDEVVQDFERALEKIRDLVRWRRSRLNEER
ncbi:endonuclease domain-containing protein [Rhodoplanes elegans]|uniref:endonuclease domain-containing protein n=1 Tax=Rhodoplanes elegans TaxID=29408 RepID=UPI0011B94578|nr:DUF559 domain-containing protein [Rhodoplanes elegans]